MDGSETDPFILGQKKDKKGLSSGANLLFVLGSGYHVGNKPEAPGHPFGLSWSGALGNLGESKWLETMEMELGNGEDDVDISVRMFFFYRHTIAI